MRAVLDQERFSYLQPAIAAAIIGSVSSLISFCVLHHNLVSADHVVSASLYLLIGGWIGAILYPCWALILGRRLQKDFEGIKWLSPRKQLYPFVSGITGALAVAAGLRAISEYDPTLLVPLMNLTVIYLAVYNILQKKVALNTIILPAILVFTGSILTSLNRLSLNIMSFTPRALLLVAVLQCGFYTVSYIVRREAVKKGETQEQLIDRVNFAVYRFFWFAIAATLINVVILNQPARIAQLIVLLTESNLFIVMMIAVIHMSLGFLQTVLENAASEYGEASKVVLIASLALPGAIILTVLVDMVSPGYLGELPSRFALWVSRSFGILAIISGIIILRFQDVRQG